MYFRALIKNCNWHYQFFFEILNGISLSFHLKILGLYLTFQWNHQFAKYLYNELEKIPKRIKTLNFIFVQIFETIVEIPCCGKEKINFWISQSFCWIALV